MHQPSIQECHQHHPQNVVKVSPVAFVKHSNPINSLTTVTATRQKNDHQILKQYKRQRLAFVETFGFFMHISTTHEDLHISLKSRSDFKT